VFRDAIHSLDLLPLRNWALSADADAHVWDMEVRPKPPWHRHVHLVSFSPREGRTAARAASLRVQPARGSALPCFVKRHLISRALPLRTARRCSSVSGLCAAGGLAGSPGP